MHCSYTDTTRPCMASTRSITAAVVSRYLVSLICRCDCGTLLLPSVWANTLVWGWAGESASALLATIRRQIHRWLAYTASNLDGVLLRRIEHGHLHRRWLLRCTTQTVRLLWDSPYATRVMSLLCVGIKMPSSSPPVLMPRCRDCGTWILECMSASSQLCSHVFCLPLPPLSGLRVC